MEVSKIIWFTSSTISFSCHTGGMLVAPLKGYGHIIQADNICWGGSFPRLVLELRHQALYVLSRCSVAKPQIQICTLHNSHKSVILTL